MSRAVKASVLMLAALSACGSDEIELPDELRGEPTCMWVAGARVHFEDGSSKQIIHPKTDTSPAVCTCMTQEEFVEGGDWKNELHEQTLELCEEVAATYDGQKWNECQDYFDSEEWLLYVFWDSEELKPPALFDPGCVGE